MTTPKKAPPKPPIPSFEGCESAALAKVAKTLSTSKSPVGDLWPALRELGLADDLRSRLVTHLVACGALPVHHSALLDMVVADLESVPAEDLVALLARVPDDPKIVHFGPALAIALRAARFAQTSFDALMVAPQGNVRRSGTLARISCERPVDAADRRVVADAMLMRVSRRALGNMTIPISEGGVWRDLVCDRAEDVHALLTRVVGDPWRALHLETFSATGPLPDDITILGFQDAPLAEVEALFAGNSLACEPLLQARKETAQELFALASQATSDRVRNIATAIGVAWCTAQRARRGCGARAARARVGGRCDRTRERRELGRSEALQRAVGSDPRRPRRARARRRVGSLSRAATGALVPS